MQVKERLALIGDQGRACERASQALQGLQTRHEESAAAGAQALAQAGLLAPSACIMRVTFLAPRCILISALVGQRAGMVAA